MTGLEADVTSARVPPSQTVPFGPLMVDYDARVLTPRAWTFEQSRWAAELAASAAPGPILELCAGAGQIGLAAAVLADRDLVQIEAEPVAAAYAVANAARAGWSHRVEVRNGPLEDAVREHERFAVVIADPPYLPTGEIGRWPEDPVSAIDGGPDGLRVMRAILDVTAAHLDAGGGLLLQVAGPGQAAEVRALAEHVTAGRLEYGDQRVIDDRRAIVLMWRV